MPILPPLLDDRTWKDIRDEALARAPIYTQEWTDFHPGDPGVALVEIFAYMTEALIYRLNRVPDNSYLAFLNLLDMPPIPGEPARGIVQLGMQPGIATATVSKAAKLKGGALPFSTMDSLSVLPIELHTFIKEQVVTKPAEGSDQRAYADAAWRDYTKRFGAKDQDRIDVSTRVYPPPDGQIMPIQRAADGALWIAVVARKDDAKNIAEVRRALGDQVLSIGMAPAAEAGKKCISCLTPPDRGGNRATSNDRGPASGADPSLVSAFRWEITAPQGTAGMGLAQDPLLNLEGNERPRYEHVTLLSDTTDGLRRDGAIKLQLPAADRLYTWKRVQVAKRTVPIAHFPVAGDFPPVLDDGDLEARVLFWLRALPAKAGNQAIDKRPKIYTALTYIGPNVVDVIQSVHQEREALGNGNGQAGQQLALRYRPILSGTLGLTVIENGVPVSWKEVQSFDGQSERDSVYILDRALGTLTVGDGLQGRVIPPGSAVIASYDYGGGLAGNLPVGGLNLIEERPDGVDPKAFNPVPTRGGSETETVEQARRRIPMRLRHQDRAVTAEDFRELTLLTPAAAIGRVEVLPLYNPTNQKKDSPGIVTVLVVPSEDPVHPRAPEPDASLLAQVCAHLDRHRLITTELYVIGPKYHHVAVYVGVAIKSGFGLEDVRKWVCLALYQFLSPLPPFGPDGAGWPLGGRINRGAIEAAVLQVDGVSFVQELRFYDLANGKYELIEKRCSPEGTAKESDKDKDKDWLELGLTELPELVEVQVGAFTAPPTPAEVGSDSGGVAVPVPQPRSKC